MYKLNYQYVPVKPGTYQDGTYPEVLLENTSPTSSHWQKLTSQLNGVWCYSDSVQTSTIEINQQGTIEVTGTGVGLSYSINYLDGIRGLHNKYGFPITSFTEVVDKPQLLTPYGLHSVNGLPSPWTIDNNDPKQATSIQYTGLNLTEYFKNHPNLVPITRYPDHTQYTDFTNEQGEVTRGYLYRTFEDSPYYYDSYQVTITNPYTFRLPDMMDSTKKLYHSSIVYTIDKGKLININLNQKQVDFHSSIFSFDQWYGFRVTDDLHFIKTDREGGSTFKTGIIDSDTYSTLDLFNWHVWDERDWKVLTPLMNQNNEDDFVTELPLNMNHPNVTKIVPVLSRQSVVIPYQESNPPVYDVNKCINNTTNYGIPNSTLCYEYINDLPNSLMDNAAIYNNAVVDFLSIVKHPHAGIKNKLTNNSKQKRSFWLPENHQNDIEALNRRYKTRPVVINDKEFDPNYDPTIRQRCYRFEMETNQDYTNILGLPQNYIDNRTLHWTNHREKTLYGIGALHYTSNDDWRYGAKELDTSQLIQVMGNSIEFYKGDIFYMETVIPNHFNASLPYPTKGVRNEHERMGNKYWQLKHQEYWSTYNDAENLRQYKFQNEAKIPLFIIPLSYQDSRLAVSASISSSIENLVVTKGSRVLVGFSLDPLNRNDNTIFIVKEGFRFDEVEQEGYHGKVLAFKLAGQEDKVKSFTPPERHPPHETVPGHLNNIPYALIGRQFDRLKRYCMPLRSRKPDGTILRYDSTLYRFDIQLIEIEDLFTTMVDKMEFIYHRSERYYQQPILLDTRFGKSAIICAPFTIYNQGFKVTVELVNPNQPVGVELPIDLDELSVDPRFKFTNRDLSQGLDPKFEIKSTTLKDIDGRRSHVYDIRLNLHSLANTIRNDSIISNRYMNNEVGRIRKGYYLTDRNRNPPYSKLMELNY